VDESGEAVAVEAGKTGKVSGEGGQYGRHVGHTVRLLQSRQNPADSLRQPGTWGLNVNKYLLFLIKLKTSNVCTCSVYSTCSTNVLGRLQLFTYSVD
jgi:hypothetical protein